MSCALALFEKMTADRNAIARIARIFFIIIVR